MLHPRSVLHYVLSYTSGLSCIVSYPTPEVYPTSCLILYRVLPRILSHPKSCPILHPRSISHRVLSYIVSYPASCPILHLRSILHRVLSHIVIVSYPTSQIIHTSCRIQHRVLSHIVSYPALCPIPHPGRVLPHIAFLSYNGVYPALCSCRILHLSCILHRVSSYIPGLSFILSHPTFQAYPSACPILHRVLSYIVSYPASHSIRRWGPVLHPCAASYAFGRRALTCSCGRFFPFRATGAASSLPCADRCNDAVYPTPHPTNSAACSLACSTRNRCPATRL